MKETELKAVIEKKDAELLTKLLVEYSQRWRHYVSLIWSISSIFIPLALSGIAIALDNFIRSVFVGVFSIGLIWIWYFTARELRLAADQNRQVYAVLESALLKLNPPLSNYGLIELVPSYKSKKFYVRELRKWIAIMVSIAWIVAIIYTTIQNSLTNIP